MKRLSDDESGIQEYELSTGRRFYAHGYTIGIARQDYGWEVSHGHDGGIDCEPGYQDSWTPVERAELADYMIEQWAAFKDAQGP